MDSNLSYYVELAMQGDQSALEEIYKQTYWTVYYTCFSFLKNEQDAADTTQEVYVTVMNSLSTLQDKDKFLYWLNRIAVNKCKNILARNNPVPVNMDSAENVIPEENENFLPEDYITNQEKRQLVMNIIRTCLNDVQYQTVFLHYFNGFSVSEIAEIMECPVGTVTSRLNIARGKIKQAVTQYENINNEKLYSVGAIPLLACLFSEEFRSLYHVSPTPANRIEGRFFCHKERPSVLNIYPIFSNHRFNICHRIFPNSCLFCKCIKRIYYCSNFTYYIFTFFLFNSHLCSCCQKIF